MSAATTAIRANDARIQQRLLKLLDRDADWLFTERLEAGIRWLDRHYGTVVWNEHLSEPTTRGMLAASAPFWAWWNNHWNCRDQHLEARLTVSQMNNGEYVLAYWATPADTLARKVFFEADQLRGFYQTRHQLLADQLAFDGDLLTRIERTARLAPAQVTESGQTAPK